VISVHKRKAVLLFLTAVLVLTPQTALGSIVVENRVRITLSFAGDCTLGSDMEYGRWNSFVEMYENQSDPDSYFLANVRPIFERDDLTIVNLEGPLTTSSAKAEKEFAFSGDPKYANILAVGSVEAVNLSNNHANDYGSGGFNDTVNALNGAGVSYYGAGTAFIREVKGVKVGLLGYKAWASDRATLNAVTNDIQSLREQGAKIVAVTFHGGEEAVYSPDTHQKTLARHAIDNGADVVVGHHPHVIQGIEIYNGKYIAYSLGNFSFGGNRNPSDKDTFIFQQTFTFDINTLEPRETQAAVYPCSISSVKDRNNFQPTPLTGAEASQMLSKLNNLSLPLNENKDVVTALDASARIQQSESDADIYYTADLPGGVTYNGKPIELTSIVLQKDGVLYVPAREYFEGLNAKVRWLSAEQSVCASVGDMGVVFSIGRDMCNPYYHNVKWRKQENDIKQLPMIPVAIFDPVNRLEPVTMPEAAFIYQNVTYVPAGLAAEMLGYVFRWDTAIGMIVITDE
jgi:poly-gamma-glutamate synthesis protein (capsule biosynthesis protein)